MSHLMPLSEDALRRARWALLDEVTARLSLQPIREAGFEAFKDGDMGSFKVLSSTETTGNERLVGEFGYVDLDGIGILITVFSRDGRRIFSLDFWRYDFAALQAFPEPVDLTVSPFVGSSNDS